MELGGNEFPFRATARGEDKEVSVLIQASQSKIYDRLEENLHALLTSALDAGDLSASRPCPITLGKEPRYLSDRRLGGPQSRPGRCGGEKSFLPGTETPFSRHSARSVVTIVTELCNKCTLHCIAADIAELCPSGGRL
jgi:hypothetical protein